MKKWKKISVILLAMIMALAMAVPASAATVKINKTKATICTGQTLQLKEQKRNQNGLVTQEMRL